jgi:hypothetical protein
MRSRIILLAGAASLGAVHGCFFIDSGTDSSGSNDAPYDPCATGAVVDLNARGTQVGDTVRFLGTNEGVGGLAPIPAQCGTPNGHQVAFTYAPRRDARLLIRTDSTRTNFDTVLWAQSSCAPARDRAYGCNDDVGSGSGGRGSAIITNVVIPAGQPITIIVAGFRGLLSLSVGAFELSVTELGPDGTEGAACRPVLLTCDPSLVCNGSQCLRPLPLGSPCSSGTLCAAGSRCSAVVDGRRCIADGADGGACRAPTTGGGCDPGLVCASVLFGQPVCSPARPVGSPCNTLSPGCAEGAWCQILLGDPRCVADGALQGRCRPSGSACDVGLTCVDSLFCMTLLAAGAACSPSDQSRNCGPDADCLRVSGADRCVPQGARNGRCRAGACDAGLTCRSSRCQP